MLDARMTWRRLVGGLILSTCTLACGGDDNSHAIEVAKFELNECKKGSSEGKLLTGRDTSDYLGLECVAWNVASSGFAIDLINREENCGFGGDESEETLWTPTARQPSAEQLELHVEWKSDGANACGSCRYDFSVVLDDISIDHDLMLEVATRSCNAKDCDWTRDFVTVPVTEDRSGIRCRYLDWSHGWPSDTEPAQGKQHGPARDGGCDDALVLTTVAKDRTVCVAPCEQDSDCPLYGLLSCDDGTCQLTAPW
jgi:hypothetical protein